MGGHVEWLRSVPRAEGGKMDDLRRPFGERHYRGLLYPWRRCLGGGRVPWTQPNPRQPNRQILEKLRLAQRDRVLPPRRRERNALGGHRQGSGAPFRGTIRGGARGGRFAFRESGNDLRTKRSVMAG